MGKVRQNSKVLFQHFGVTSLLLFSSGSLMGGVAFGLPTFGAPAILGAGMLTGYGRASPATAGAGPPTGGYVTTPAHMVPGRAYSAQKLVNKSAFAWH